ncbi:hypothetical protein FQA39_LY11971 [Lamprigera yunnana]|nr:hypothetical protein FQA39_LY11971 [Lamprigera yunnana]
MPEVELFVRCLILYFSIIKEGNTFGQKLVAIKYENMTQNKRLLYAILSCSDYLLKLDILYRFSNINKYLQQFVAFIKICNFINLSYFLKTGKYPILLDRILGLKQVYAHDVSRTFGSKYLTRELLWNGFIEILVYVIPLINYHKLKRILFNMIPMSKKFKTGQPSAVIFTTQTMCTHCGMSPVNPHRMDCPHIFCYTCLKGNQIADPQYQCQVCQNVNVVPVCQREKTEQQSTSKSPSANEVTAETNENRSVQTSPNLNEYGKVALSRPNLQKKRKYEELTNDVLAIVRDHFKRPMTQDDHYDLFGKSYAMRLKSLEKDQLLLVETKMIFYLSSTTEHHITEANTEQVHIEHEIWHEYTNNKFKVAISNRVKNHTTGIGAVQEAQEDNLRPQERPSPLTSLAPGHRVLRVFGCVVNWIRSCGFNS